ncbi:MAG: enoyl-CoA hydratase [Thermodesulfobacteriota bacterium]|nr:enoyl-CoA hydratase [Thermodesulfobacteriota bacterium]
MNYDDILFKKEDRVATIMFNRPDSLNALGGTMREDIIDAISDIKRDKNIGALVITGSGRAFCAGGNIKEMERMSIEVPLVERREFVRGVAHKIITEIRALKKPVIASINGHAIGAGCNIALACDMRIASDKAKLGVGFINMGLVSDYGGLYFLPRLVGVPKAIEMYFSGDVINAVEAERIGMVNKTVRHEELEKITYELASRIAKKAPIALGMIKDIMYKGLNMNLADELDLEADAQSICLKTEDHREGVRAFLEKRKPVFKGQ